VGGCVKDARILGSPFGASINRALVEIEVQVSEAEILGFIR